LPFAANATDDGVALATVITNAAARAIVALRASVLIGMVEISPCIQLKYEVFDDRERGTGPPGNAAGESSVAV